MNSKMAPSGRRRIARATKRSHYKQQLVQSVIKETTSKDLPSNSLTKSDDLLKGTNFDGVDISNNGCSTPKAKRHQIPEILTCPPAPKKRRVLSNSCLLQRSPIAFFAPPDLEVFFFFARRNIF